MTVIADEPVLALTGAQWRAWLARHHAQATGVRLQLAKAAATGLRYPEALDAALSWGWIDGQKWPLDQHAWLQRFTQRRARSPWSKINRAKAEALIAAGAMHPPGLAEVERARGDGRWAAAYAGAKTATVPADLAAALAADPAAQRAFDALDGANRYAILYRVQHVKKAATRAAKIAGFVAMLVRGETVHPVRAPRR